MNKEELIADFKEKVLKGEMTLEDVKKAMEAGYETPTEKTQTEIKAEVEAAEETSTEEKVDTKDLVFADGLFGEYTLGSTINQNKNGGTIQNIRPEVEYGKKK